MIQKGATTLKPSKRKKRKRTRPSSAARTTMGRSGSPGTAASRLGPEHPRDYGKNKTRVS
jgi:hypothetical protein